MMSRFSSWLTLPDLPRLSADELHVWRADLRRREPGPSEFHGRLSIALDGFEVSLQRGAPAALLSTRPDEREASRSAMRDVMGRAVQLRVHPSPSRDGISMVSTEQPHRCALIEQAGRHVGVAEGD
jgi:hypothetical protein